MGPARALWGPISTSMSTAGLELGTFVFLLSIWGCKGKIRRLKIVTGLSKCSPSIGTKAV